MENFPCGAASSAPALQWRLVLLSACLGALLLVSLSLGRPVRASEPTAGPGATWAQAEGGYRFGLMPFYALPKSREWSLGAARELDWGDGERTWSYFGAGVSIGRSLRGATDPEADGLLDDIEMGAWVGGCLSCSLGGGATIDVEMRWAAESLSIGGAPLSGEQSSGLMLRIPW